MGRLGSVEHAAGNQIERFRRAADPAALSDLLRTSCLLELSKLAAARLDLGSYVRSVVEVLSSFLTVDGIGCSAWVPGLPPTQAVAGELGEVLLARLTAPEPVGVGRNLCFPLADAGATIGCLVVGGARVELGHPAFLSQVAEHLDTGLAVVGEAERLRRDAAVSNALRLAASVEPTIVDERLEELVRVMATLPQAVGARLSVELPVVAGGTADLEAGVTVGSEPSEHVVDLDGRGSLVGRLWWHGSPPADEERRVAAILDTLAGSLLRAEHQRVLREEAETDALTGLGNRRLAGRALAAGLQRADRCGEPLTVLSIDLDEFKKVNDTLGHDVGDEVLRSAADALRSCVRHGDSVARMGGEELLVVAPGVDPLVARRLAGRLREAVTARCAAVLPEGWKQTISVGIATYPEAAEGVDQLLRAADTAMYEAKRTGRDRACTAPPAPRRR